MKGVEVAIEHGVDIPHLQVGAMVFDQPIRMQDVRPDLGVPRRYLSCLENIVRASPSASLLDLIEA